MMSMRPRQDLIDLFSAFMQFEGDRFRGWVQDGRLRRNMQRNLANCASPPQPAPEAYWVLYWYQRWTQPSDTATALAFGHLSAYLQESCYWAAERTVRKISDTHYPLSDCFQMAIAKVHTVLKRFKPERGASLKAFANLVFPSLLAEEIRVGQEVTFSTNFGLLRRVSKKRLIEALRQVGLSPTEIAQYKLAWVCFNTLYVPKQVGTKSLPQVDADLWLKITTLYNTERRTQLDRATPDCTPAIMEGWLNQCAAWVRAYLCPAIESLNVAKLGLESGGEMQDDLANPEQESLLADLINLEQDQESQKQRADLQTAIATALTQLEPKLQTILQLYYQQGLTQKQIMRTLSKSQSTVSRDLGKARETLLTALVQWSQTTLNISPTPHRIKEMSAALEEWLGVHYTELYPDSSSITAEKEMNL
jgi:RNA polymerase sigma factor (sigma-70 family)